MSQLKKPYQLKQEIKLVDYALYLGYRLDKKKSSTGWVKMVQESTGDKILVGIGKGKEGEDLYKSIIDERNDNGDILSFCGNRIESGAFKFDKKQGFYKAFLELNRILGISITSEFKAKVSEKDKFMEKKNVLSSLQEFNHVPLKDKSFFLNERYISEKTLDDPLFKNRLFNTYFKTEHGHLITNYAFGKYQGDTLVGLEVRNKNLKTIIGEHEAVFVSNFNHLDKIDIIFYAESGIDVLSHYELLKANGSFDNKNILYLSSGGNFYDTKINKILEYLDILPIHQQTKFVSITDNDKDGHFYDLYFTAMLINKLKHPVEFTRMEKDIYKYDFLSTSPLSFLSALKNEVNKINERIDQDKLKDQFGTYFVLKEEADKVSLMFPKGFNPGSTEFKEILKALHCENLYISHKPKLGKDWNEQLITLKKKMILSTTPKDQTQSKIKKCRL